MTDINQLAQPSTIYDLLKWLSVCIAIAITIYFSFFYGRKILELQREARELIVLTLLQELINRLNVTDSNYDAIIIEFDKLHYLNQPATRLKDEFLKKFAKVHEKRLNAKMNNASLIPVRAENMIKEIESNLSQVAKDRAKTKDRILMKELNAKEDMLIIQLETLTNLITVAGVEPVKTR